MNSIKNHQSFGIKRKKLKKTDNSLDDELITSLNKKQKVHKEEESIWKSYCLKGNTSLKNKSHSKTPQNQTKSVKRFKNKLNAIKSSNNIELSDKDNIVNKSFKNKTKVLKSSLPKDIPCTSPNKLNKKKLKRGKVVKITNFENRNSSANQKVLKSKDSVQPRKKHKLKKVFKKHQIIENDDVQEPQSAEHKRFENAENSSLEKNIIVSDDSEDIAIRNEIQNSSIYKKIQKLLNENPSLTSSLSYNDSLAVVDQTSYGNLDEENASESIENDESSSSESTENAKSISTFTADSTKTSNTILKVKLPQEKHALSFVSQNKGSLSRDHVNKSEKIKASTSLRNKAREKLQAAKFRLLNEKLYTENGKDSFTYFQDNQDEFQDYHMGYSLQVSKWPINPVDKIISSLKNEAKTCVIADMGCGDAKIARNLTDFTVHSYDLVALNDHVTPCNISKVPLSNESVDIVVFCLSLMGTNWKDYLQEAYRITKMGGFLKIAEVESRIENLDLLIKNIQSLGFALEKKDVEHKLFVFLDFRKEKRKKSKNAKVKDVVLKPCLYKKR